MNNYWSGLYSSSIEFHSHEWSVHGTCWNPAAGNASNYPAQIVEIIDSENDLGDVNKFFSVALNVHNNNNVMKALETAGL